MKSAIPAAHKLTAFGQTKSVEDWVQDPMCLASEGELRFRLSQGWPAERAITSPSSSNGGKLSKFKGVTWHVKKACWMAQIKHAGKVEFLGYFAAADEVLAARAYDKRCREARGADAETNFES